MARIPIALQLYSIRKDCAAGLRDCLEAVARMGYEGVEFAGYYDHSAQELRKMLDNLNLQVAGTHIGIDTLMGDALPRTVEFNQELGNRFLIVPGLPEERRNSRQAWLETAHLMNEAAERVRPYGMRVGYHNHYIEFSPMDGELPWDTFFGNTHPEVVMQLDTGNAMHGGADPVLFLQRYPGRAATVHLKEYSATNPEALVGEGDVRWNEVFAACESQGGTEWYIVEQESYPCPPLEAVETCLRNLRKMGK